MMNNIFNTIVEVKSKMNKVMGYIVAVVLFLFSIVAILFGLRLLQMGEVTPLTFIALALGVGLIVGGVFCIKSTKK